MKKEQKDGERNQAHDAGKPTGPPRKSGAWPGLDLGIGMVDLIHEIRNPLNGMDTTLQLMARHLSGVGGHEDPVLVSYVEGLKKKSIAFTPFSSISKHFGAVIWSSGR